MRRGRFVPLLVALSLVAAGCGSSHVRTTPVDLLKESGTATQAQMEHVTAPFNAQAGWTLSWSYDCTHGTQAPLFEAFVMGSDGTAIANTGMQSAVKQTQQAVVSVGGQGLTVDLYAGPNCVWAVIASQ